MRSLKQRWVFVTLSVDHQPLDCRGAVKPDRNDRLDLFLAHALLKFSAGALGHEITLNAVFYGNLLLAGFCAGPQMLAPNL